MSFGSVSGQYPWHSIGPGGGGDFSCITQHPTNENIMYSGSFSGGIFKSTDAGQSWTSINNNLVHTTYGTGNYQVNDIVIDPIDHDKIYICTSIGLFQSINEGQAWNLQYPTALNGESDRVSVATLAIDPAKPDTLYMGLGDGMNESQALHLDFEDYVGVTGFLKSVDGGEHWSSVELGMPEMTAVQSICINPLNTSQVTVATTKGVFRSGVNSTTQIWKAGFPFTHEGGMVAATESTQINNLDEVSDQEPMCQGDSIIIEGTSKTGETIQTNFIYGDGSGGTHGTTLGDMLSMINASGPNGWGDFAQATLVHGQIYLEDLEASDSQTSINMYAAPSNQGSVAVPYFEEVSPGFTASENSVPQVWEAGFPYTLDGMIPAQNSSELNDLWETSDSYLLLDGDEIVINGMGNYGQYKETLFIFGSPSAGNDYMGTTLGDLLDVINTEWGDCAIASLVSGRIHLEDILPGNSETTINMYASPGNAGEISIPYFRELSAGFTPGDYWGAKHDGLPHRSVNHVADAIIDDHYTLFALLRSIQTTSDTGAVIGGLFRSDNSGETWTDITANLPLIHESDSMFYDYASFDIDPNNPNNLYIASRSVRGSAGSKLYRIHNGANDWELVPNWSNVGWMSDNWLREPSITDIAISSFSSGLVSVCGSGVIQSPDAGETWQQNCSTPVGEAWQGNSLEMLHAEAIAFHPNDPDIVYAGYDEFGLFRSEDNGLSFIRLDSTQNPALGTLQELDAVKDIMVDPDNGDLYISRWQGSSWLQQSGGIVFSSDGGNSIRSISYGLPSGRCDLILDKNSGTPGSRTLYAAIYEWGMYKSINSGVSWEAINTGLGANARNVWEIAIDPDDSSTLFLGINSHCNDMDGLYKSIDGGASWMQQLSFPVGDVLAIQIDESGTIWGSVTNDYDWSNSGGLYQSTDGGISWIQMHNHSRIIDIEVHPIDQNTILATGQPMNMIGGDAPELLLSISGGAEWQDISLGIQNGAFSFAHFNPHRPDQIYVGTRGGGIWRHDDMFTGTRIENEAPQTFNLDQNFPNPFNPSTNIHYELSTESNVSLWIYDVRGRIIQTLVSDYQPAGRYDVVWNAEAADGNSIGAGVYFVRLTAGLESQTIKMLHLK